MDCGSKFDRGSVQQQLARLNGHLWPQAKPAVLDEGLGQRSAQRPDGRSKVSIAHLKIGTGVVHSLFVLNWARV